MTNKHRETSDIDNAIILNAGYLKKYLEKDDTKGIATAYINIAGLFFARNDHNESLIYLDKTKKYIEKVDDPLIKSRFFLAYGRNYSSLKLFRESNENLDKAIYFAKKSSDVNRKEKFIFLGNIWKWQNFKSMKLSDSVNAIQNKSLKLFKKEPIVYQMVADHFIEKKQHLDSAEYYLNKTFPLLNNHHIEEKAMVLNTFGDLYTAKKDYKKALDYYHQVLNIYNKMNRKRSILLTYKCISHVYDLSGDSVNENEYLKKYTLLHDSIEIDERKTYNNIVEKIISENEAEDGKNKNIFFIAIAILAAISGVIIYFVSKAYAKKHKLKDKIISEKETETDELKKKLNTAFEEINQLAKSRDPLFLARFKEVYPEFFEKLTAKNPDLTEHDIKFAAYIRLNLTNKDIVQFENTTLRAIEMKKYRLKKKFDLSSDIDFSKWILEL